MTSVILKPLGLLGGVCFSYAALPAAIATFKKGSSIGTPIFIAWSILIGTVIMYSYLLLSYGFDWVLAINYSVEFLTWLTIVKFHYFPRKQ